VFDVQQDRQERPTRPIVSGRVPMWAAVLLGVILLAAGVAMASTVAAWSLFIAGCLVPAILGYDAMQKRTPLGPLGMGLCRFLNVMLGASDYQWHAKVFFWGNPQITCAIALSIYIVGVTWFARTEARQSSRAQLVLALIVLLGGIGGLAWLIGYRPSELRNPMIAYLMLGMVAANLTIRGATAIADPTPARVQPMIKLMLLSYVMLCATMVYWHTANGNLALATACLVIPAMLFGKFIPMT
jgi:4-hydroxybenzoate polyprenyltransferase